MTATGISIKCPMIVVSMMKKVAINRVPMLASMLSASRFSSSRPDTNPTSHKSFHGMFGISSGCSAVSFFSLDFFSFVCFLFVLIPSRYLFLFSSVVKSLFFVSCGLFLIVVWDWLSSSSNSISSMSGGP